VLPETEIVVAPEPLPAIDTVLYTAYDIHTGWDVGQGVGRALANAVAGRGLAGRAVGIELDHMPASWLSAVAGSVGLKRDIAGVLWQIRHIKDDAEIAQIQANVAGNDRMFETVQRMLRPGVTEVEIWASIFGTLCEISGGPASLIGDLGGGARSSNPDATPTLEALQIGDQLLVDIYSSTACYFADTTRNFVLGQPSALQSQIHSILQEALATGEEALLPGARACDIDATVRGVIDRAGYGAHFPHHSGHAFGLFAQELPFLIPAETTALEAGMTVTLEPGIYVDGWGGMRLEGNYLVTDAGARALDHFPRELTVCHGGAG
jgi:Xaa-Pro aminopeptidase